MASTSTTKKPVLRRWLCPRCGKGQNAPERPRRDDVRRYCLPCSKATGRLVERSAPAVEAKRTAAAKRTAERTKKARARKTAAARRDRDQTEARRVRARERALTSNLERRTVGGLDLLVEAERLWNLPVMRQNRSKLRWVNTLPSIEFRQSRTKSYSSGRCWPAAQRIHITVGTDPADALATLLHELVHAVMPPFEHHSDRFWRALRSAAREAWPDAPFAFNTPGGTGYRQQQQITSGLRSRQEAA